MWLHTMKSRVRYWACIQYLRWTKRWPRKTYRRKWSLSATPTLKEKEGNIFSVSWSLLSEIRKRRTIQGGMRSRMVNVLQEVWAFHNNLILWRERALSVLVLPNRMAVNQETHPPFTGDDIEINSCFLTGAAIFTILKEICSKNAFTSVQENSHTNEKDTSALPAYRNSFRDLCFRFLPCTGAWMLPSHFWVSVLIRTIKPKENYESLWENSISAATC